MDYQNTGEATGDMTGNKISDAVAKSHNGKNTKVSRSSPQNDLETITNEHDKEASKVRYIYLQKRDRKL